MASVPALPSKLVCAGFLVPTRCSALPLPQSIRKHEKKMFRSLSFCQLRTLTSSLILEFFNKLQKRNNPTLIRMPPRHLEPTPVMRTHQVAVGDLITAINGLPVMGCDTLVVANVLQALPTCVTLRLTKYAAQCFNELVMIQVRMQGKGKRMISGVFAKLVLEDH